LLFHFDFNQDYALEELGTGNAYSVIQSPERDWAEFIGICL